MMSNALAAYLRRDVHLGTSQSSKSDIYLPLSELKKSSVHIAGASGYGKSYFIRSLIKEFVSYGQPFGLIDPHGDLYEYAVSLLQRSAVPRKKVILLDPSDHGYSVAFNPLYTGVSDPDEAASLVLEACLKAWGARSYDDTPRLEGLLRGTFRLLIEGGLTLLEAPAVLDVDGGELRLALRERLTDELARRDWAEFEKWSRQEKLAIAESTRNRLRRFLQSEAVQLMVGQRDRALNVQQSIDEGKYLLANLGGVQAPETQRLLGALLVNSVLHAAKRRNIRKRRDWFLVVDEAGQFASRDVGDSLDQLRKYGVHFILAHQRLGQLEREDPDLLSSITTNARIKAVFGGLTRTDAERMARELFTGQVRGDRLKHVTYQTKFRPIQDTAIVETENWSESEGKGQSSAQTLTESNGWGQSVCSGSDEDASGDTASQFNSNSRSSGKSSGLSSSSSLTTGGSRSVVPIVRHEEFREETSRQFWTLDEEWERYTSDVHGLAKREVLIRVHSGPVLRLRTPDVAEERNGRSLKRFKNRVLSSATYATPAPSVYAEIASRREQVRSLVQNQADRSRQVAILPSRSTTLTRRRS